MTVYTSANMNSINCLPFSLLRRQENQKRLANSGPQREVSFSIPDEGPNSYLKRFSMDGRLLFAFGGESRFLIYPVEYKGCDEGAEPKFKDFFRSEAIEIDVISGLRNVEWCPEIVSGLLCRDFCLSIRDDEDRDSHVILASSSPADRFEVDDRPPQTFMFRSGNRIFRIPNDSHSALPALDHVTFFLVSLSSMKVVDFIHFKYDFIYLAHHLGVGFEASSGIFSVLSIKNQRIFTFKIENDSFVPSGQFGRNSFEDNEEESVKLSTNLPQRDDSWGRSGIHGLTLKLINHLYKRNSMDLSRVPLPYSILEHLHMWKHQLLPDNRILIRLVPGTIILSTNPRHQSMVHALDPLPTPNQNSYLVLMNRTDWSIDAVFNSADVGLLDWIKNNWIWLRGRSANVEDFDILNYMMEHTYNVNNADSQNICNAAIRRFTNLLPQSPQQLSESPFLDSRNFRWDPKVSSVISKSCPISCNYFVNSDAVSGATGLFDSNYGPGPVKFFSRLHQNLLSHSIRFVDEEVVLATLTETGSMDRHKWINVIFHPNLPLILIYQYGIFRSMSIKVLFN